MCVQILPSHQSISKLSLIEILKQDTYVDSMRLWLGIILYNLLK